MLDIDKAMSLIPGKKKINVHACYAVFNGEKADRDELKPEHFGDVLTEYLNRENVSSNYIDEILKYEKNVLLHR